MMATSIDLAPARWEREAAERRRQAREKALWQAAIRASEERRQAHNARAVILLACLLFWSGVISVAISVGGH